MVIIRGVRAKSSGEVCATAEIGIGIDNFCAAEQSSEIKTSSGGGDIVFNISANESNFNISLFLSGIDIRKHKHNCGFCYVYWV